MDASALIRKAADICEERHATYGDTYKLHAQLLMLFFPNGMAATLSEEDWERFTFINMIAVKLSRYIGGLHRGEIHGDSTLDLGNYAFLLHQFDIEAQNGRTK